MKKRLEQAFLETTILLEWLDSKMLNSKEIISDDLIRQSIHNERKYDKIARRLGYPTRYEEIDNHYE